MPNPIQEHDAPVLDALGSSQPPEIQSVSKMVDELHTRYKRARYRYDQHWHPAYEFIFGGKQWTVGRPAWRFAEVCNLIWANIVTEVGIQTDNRPKVEYTATEPSDFDFAKLLQKINEVNWTKYPWLQRVADALLQCKWIHAVHAEIYWDSDLEDGLGDIGFRLLNPFYCYWDPQASNVDDLRGFVYAAPVPTGELKKKYPQFADEIKPDVQFIGQQYSDAVSTDSDRFQVGAQNMIRSMRNADLYGGEPMTFLKRVWLKDDAVEEYEEEKDDGTKEFVLKKRYPGGRYIEKCNNLILVDGPNGIMIDGKLVPYEDHSFPIARLVNYSYPLEYAGCTEYEHLRGPQKVLNYVWSHTLDQMKMSNNPLTFIGASSGLDPDNYSNEPGQKVLVNDVNQVRREPGLGLASGTDLLMTQAKAMFDTVSGLMDVMKGAVDPSVSSAIMLDGYVEAAQVRPRLKNRNLDQFLQRIGKLMLARYLQFYTADRVFRITNEEGWPEFVSFSISRNEKGGKVANVTTVGPKGPMGTTQIPIKGIPDVEAISGSALPFAKALKSKTSLEYYNAGVIDQEEVLKAVDWPNYQQVLERMQKNAAEQAAARAQGGQ